MENSIVLCLRCHGEVGHYNPGHPIGNKYTPSELRRHRDRLWEWCKRNPGVPLPKDPTKQVLREITLAPHSWKNQYMELYPGHFRNTGYSFTERDGDVWDMLTEVAVHRYSVDEWKKYLPLFDVVINNVIARLKSILTAHRDVIPINIKLEVLRTNSQLEVERAVYLQLPQIISLFGDEDVAFAARFKETIELLSALARFADKERKALEPDT